MERFREIEIVYNIIRFDNKFAFSRPLPTPNPKTGRRLENNISLGGNRVKSNSLKAKKIPWY